jgi:diaminopimelate decarboxylase
MGKKLDSEHSFAIVDGAMNDLLRPSFYNAYHQVLPINEKNTTKNHKAVLKM